MNRLDEQIRRKRLARCWSQEFLASMVKVHRTTIQNWESGRTKPKGLHLWALERVLGCKLSHQ